MATTCHRYEYLATLLEYPTERTRAELEAGLADFRASCPGPAESLCELHTFLESNSLETAQETYTHTFDISAVCCLHVGYHLFGEDYQRGLFMARLRESQDELGVEAGGELPDYLPVMLRWLARLSDSEVYAEALSECVFPALDKMSQGFSEGANPYRRLPEAVREVLRQDLEACASEPARRGGR